MRREDERGAAGAAGLWRAGRREMRPTRLSPRCRRSRIVACKPAGLAPAQLLALQRARWPLYGFLGRLRTGHRAGTQPAQKGSDALVDGGSYTPLGATKRHSVRTEETSLRMTCADRIVTAAPRLTAASPNRAHPAHPSFTAPT